MSCSHRSSQAWSPTKCRSTLEFLIHKQHKYRTAVHRRVLFFKVILAGVLFGLVSLVLIEAMKLATKLNPTGIKLSFCPSRALWQVRYCYA